MIFTLVFIMGLCIGSFLNVVIDRVPRNQSIVGGRSYCDSCHHQLNWYDLLPILSFLMLKGHCRYCGNKIYWQNPLVELLTGTFFLLIYFVLPLNSFNNIIFLIYSLIIISICIVVALIDFKYGIIPNKIVVFSFIVSATYIIYSGAWLDHLIAALAAFVLFLLLVLVTRGKGMGIGDIKFAAFMGLSLGLASLIVSLYIAFLTGALVAIILVISKRKKFQGGKIPFGPFLALGTAVGIIQGPFLWTFLLRLLGM